LPMQTAHRVDYVSYPAGALRGTLQVPGDKSISHRAIILGAIAEGQTRISGFLESADTLITAEVFREMGVRIERDGEETVVHGAGLHGLMAPAGPLYFGNSGTSVRLLAGLLCGQPFSTRLEGDASLSARPMQRIVEPLRKMGAGIQCSPDGTLPLEITGGNTLRGIRYALPVASAQLKSALLLAGLYAGGSTRLVEPAVTRDHTERMLADFAGQLSCTGNTIELHPGPLRACTVHVPGDISSAAFFLVAAVICPGSDLILKNVGINPTRNAVLEILSLMGADLTVKKKRSASAEPLADIHVRHCPLSGIRIPPELVPVAIDEFPAILATAACAAGETVLDNASELRVKESDRIEAMAAGLSRLGIQVVTRPDGITVTGGSLQGGEVDSFGDHRIAMAFAVAAARAAGPVKIHNCANVATSYPGFVEAGRGVGMRIDIEDSPD